MQLYNLQLQLQFFFVINKNFFVVDNNLSCINGLELHQINFQIFMTYFLI